METMTTLRRALITGATSGIGSAFTSALPSTDLLLTGRNGGRLVEMCAELERPDREVDFVQADLACVEERETLISRAEEFGIDLLVNNAGLGPYDRAGEHHLGHHGAVAVGARDEHAHVIGTVLVDPARAVEAQHLPGRGGGDHHIADVVDGGEQIRADLDSLTETEIVHDGRRFLVRSAPRPAASLAVRAAGVALPPTVQPLAAD
jgi:NAD(P)-dependent dehydrogenase (short-subunit alcohol dehydrogenase family)